MRSPFLCARFTRDTGIRLPVGPKFQLAARTGHFTKPALLGFWPRVQLWGQRGKGILEARTGWIQPVDCFLLHISIGRRAIVHGLPSNRRRIDNEPMQRFKLIGVSWLEEHGTIFQLTLRNS